MNKERLFRIRRQNALLALFMLCIALGTHEAREVPEHDLFELILPLFLQIYFVIWCGNDAGFHGRPFTHSWNQPLFLFPLLMVPLYFLGSRGLRGCVALAGYTALLGGATILGALLGGGFSTAAL